MARKKSADGSSRNLQRSVNVSRIPQLLPFVPLFMETDMICDHSCFVVATSKPDAFIDYGGAGV